MSSPAFVPGGCRSGVLTCDAEHGGERRESKPSGTSHLSKETRMTSRYRRMAVLGTIGVALAMSQQACAKDACCAGDRLTDPDDAHPIRQYVSHSDQRTT